MQDDIRKSGIAAVGDIRWGTHFCEFYQTKQDLIDTLVPYFKAGLENNEFCMWVTDNNLTVEEARKAMTKAIPGFTTNYLKKGQIEIQPCDEWYLHGGSFKSKVVVNGLIKKLEQAQKKGFAGLRLTGNTFWLEKKDRRSFADYEKTVNDAIGKYKMVALCTYSLEKCSAAEIVDAISTHEFALIKREDKWEILENSRYKTTKEGLIESEKLFRLALKNAPVTVAAQDRDLRFLWAYNQQTIRPEDVLGKTDFDIFSKTDAKKLSALKNKAMETGKPLNTKMWMTSNHKKVFLKLYFEPMRNEQGEITGVEVATVNLTREKQMEDALKESEDQYHNLFENMTEGLALCEMIFDKNGKPCDYRFLSVNPLIEKFLGLTSEKIAGKTAREIIPNVQPNAIELFGNVVTTGKSVHFDNYSRDLARWFDVYAYRVKPGQFAYMLLDITERKQAEEAQRQSEERFKAIAASTPDHILVQDNNLRYTFVVNPQLGLTEKDMIGKTDYDIMKKADADKLTKIKRKVIENGESEHLETSVTNSKGEMDYFSGSYVPRFNEEGRVDGLIGYFQNVSERKRAENALKESEERFRVLAEASPVIISVTRVSDNVVLYVNKSYSDAMGYKYEDLIGKPVLNVYYDPAERKALIDKLNEQGYLQNYEVRVKKADGTPFWSSSSVRFVNFGGERAVMGASLDISERKIIEHNVIRLNREVQAIRECDQIIVHAADETSLLADVCRILCETAGYHLAWVGSVENDQAKSIHPMVWNGDGNYLASANITWADTERGNGPTGLAVRTGTTHFFQDFASDPKAEPWRKAALAQGYRSSIAIPLKESDHKVFAILCLYSAEPNSFNPAEIRLLEELASDISFGILALRDRERRRQAEQELIHLASFPELNPNPIVELTASGNIIYLNPAAKNDFPDLLSHGLKHPFLYEWDKLINTINTGENQSILREVQVGQIWYLQTVTYVTKTKNYHIYGRNVTELKIAQDALIENDKLMTAFFDSPGIMRGIVEIVDDTTVRHIRDNSTTGGFIGMAPKALANQLSSELGEPPEIIRTWVNNYRLSLRIHKPITFEYLDQRGDNKAWLSATVSYLRDNLSGQPQFAYVVQDINARKQAEERLKETQRVLEDAQHIAQLGTWVWNTKTGDLRWSKELYEIYGEDPDSFTPTIEAYGEFVHPDDRDFVNKVLNNLMFGGQSVDLDFRIILRDKSTKYLHATSSVSETDDEGKAFIYIGTTQDITERKKNEEALQISHDRFYSALSEMPSGILLVTNEGLTEFVNQAFCEIFDLKQNPQELKKLTANQVIDSIKNVYKDPEKAVLRIHDIVAASKIVKDEDIPLQGGRTLLRDFIPIDLGKNKYGRLWIYREITARKRIEEQLQNSQIRFKLLSEINSLLLTSKQPETIIRTIADKVMEYLHCEAFFNFIVDETSGRLKLNGYAGIPPEAAKEIEWLDFGAAICGCVARDNQPIISVNVQKNGDERAALVRSYGIQAYASYPLRNENKTIGTISFGTRSRTSFNYDELSMIEIVADQISVAMRKKQAEADLKASEERSRSIIVTAMDGLWTNDISGRFLFVNDVYCQTIGYTREELLTMRISDIEAAEKQDETKEHILKVFQQGGDRFETKHKRKDGTILDIEISAKYSDIGNGQLVVFARDITERKKAEAELKASEERFSNAFHSSPVALSISRVSDGKFVDVNNSFLHLFGYKREEIIGQKAAELNIYDNPENRVEIIRRLEQQGKVVNYEVTARTKTGNEIKALTSAEKIMLNGQTHINWTTIDITDREQAEELLRETSNYLNNLLDYANAPIIVWDPHFRISRFNPAFERLTGYQSHEVIGLNLDILFPEDKKPESMQLIRMTLSGERWEVVEIPILRVDGEVRTVLWNSANVYDNDGRKIIATIAQGQDITERKQADEAMKISETKYRRLFEAAKDGILLLDGETGQIIDVNPFLEEMLGLSYKEFIGKNLWELGYFKDIVSNKDNFTELQKKKYIRYEDLPLRNADGLERKVEFVSNLYEVDHRKIIQCNIRDITERKKAEENIKQLNVELKHHSTELEASNKELEAFAYSVSHDLRAPLRSMEGFSQALLEDCKDILNDECKDYLRRIQNSAELMAQLIDDLLQLSRLTRVEMLVDNVNLSDMALSIAAELKKLQPQRQVEFNITPGLIGRGDGKLLRIALYNLLENAWKFTGKVPVAHIEFGAVDDDGNTTYFVRDNGAGFDMKYADKMFNPFQRLHTVGEFPGTGIGLASVQRVIHRHGGVARAEGKVGEGATFYFTLG